VPSLLRKATRNPLTEHREQSVLRLAVRLLAGAILARGLGIWRKHERDVRQRQRIAAIEVKLSFGLQY
jgi:hypothetical protein